MGLELAQSILIGGSYGTLHFFSESLLKTIYKLILESYNVPVIKQQTGYQLDIIRRT